MGRPRTFDHDAAQALAKSGMPRSAIAKHFGVTPSAIDWVIHYELRRQGRAYRERRSGTLPHQRILTALGIDGRSSSRAARAAALSARIRSLRTEAHSKGTLPWGPLQAAFAHEAGLTLDEIDEIYAVPPAEAARAIALHAGR